MLSSYAGCVWVNHPYEMHGHEPMIMGNFLARMFCCKASYIIFGCDVSVMSNHNNKNTLRLVEVIGRFRLRVPDFYANISF